MFYHLAATFILSSCFGIQVEAVCRLLSQNTSESTVCKDVLSGVFQGADVNCTENEELCEVWLIEDRSYVISGEIIVQDVRLRITGMGAGAQISCNFEHSDGRYYLHFMNNREVVLKNVHFARCPAPISLESVGGVRIADSSFRYFTEAVFEIFNSLEVNVSSCVFEHNQGSGRSLQINRGNTGCLSIGYHNLNNTHHKLSVMITDSKFMNNTAFVTNSMSTPFINKKVYRGRGGAIGLFLDEGDVTALIHNCTFESNCGIYGGCIYAGYNGIPGETIHSVTVTNSLFIRNKAEIGGAGVNTAFFINGPSHSPLLTEIIETDFIENEAGEVGGGVAIAISDPDTVDAVKARIVRCNFVGNKAGRFGSAIRLAVFTITLEKNVQTHQEIINCTFRGNTCPRGTVGVAHVPLDLTGTIRFEDNIGQSLRVIESVVTVDGQLFFSRNDASRTGGGTLFISSFGQVLIKSHSTIEFENNTGSTGSAIVVDGQRSSATFPNILYNPLCFLLVEDFAIPPKLESCNTTNRYSKSHQMPNVSVLFKGNTAKVGADVFASSLESCSWFSNNNPFFSIREFQNWKIFGNTASSIQTKPSEVNIQLQGSHEHSNGQNVTTIGITAGVPTQLNPILIDQFGLGTVGTIQFKHGPELHLKTPDYKLVDIHSQPSVLLVSSNESVSLEFTLESDEDLSDNDLQSISGVLFVDDLERNKLTVLYVQMNSCPPGQSLKALGGTKGNYGCQCDNANQHHIVLCDNTEQLVILQLGYWSVHAGSTLHGHSCPPGYCRCNDATSFSSRACYPSYSISQPEKQCVCGREGILCGRCSSSDSGLTALYLHCEDCHPAMGTIIIFAVIIQASAVGLIVFFNIKLPSWMVPVLFYIRMASYFGYYFPPTFERVGKYLYFLSSLTSLYFPYDLCLPTSSALGVFAVRFTPLLVAVVVWPCAFLGNKKWKGVFNFEGSLTLGVLLFSHIIHTSLQALNCPFIYNTNNEIAPRWYHDGEEKCFAGPHAGLALAAVASLLAVLALCVLLVVIASGRVRRRWMCKLRTALVEEYFTDAKRLWWILAEVIRRVLLLLILVIFPRSTVGPLVALALLLFTYSYCQPYKSGLTNFLDVFLLSSLALLIALPSNQLVMQNLFQLYAQTKLSEEGMLLWFRTHVVDNKLDMYARWNTFAFPNLIITHPRILKQLLKEPKIHPIYELLKPWLGEGLLISNGDKWFKNRRLLTPAFHVQVLKQYMTIFNSCTQELITKWESKMSSHDCFDIFGDISLLSLDIILQTSFGHKSHCQSEQKQSKYVNCIYFVSEATLLRRVKIYLIPNLTFNLSPTGFKYRRAVSYIHQRTEEVIQERRMSLLKEEEQKRLKENRRMDLLDVLLTAKDEDGVGMPDEQIRNEVNTFLFEGHDTTASGLAWSLYCLAKYPEHQEKCRQEVMQVLGGRTQLEWEDLKSLEYTTMCIKEAMRLFPPVPGVVRATAEDMHLDGYFVPKGTSLLFDLFAIHRNPRVWDNPEEYDPLRFTPENSKDRDPFAYLPFSAGPRNCIGQMLAINEERVVVATILKRFVMSVEPERPTKFKPGLILKTAQGMWLRFTSVE